MITPHEPDGSDPDDRLSAADWLHHWSRKDAEFRVIVDDALQPKWPPLMRFIQWALKNGLLQPTCQVEAREAIAKADS